VSTYYSYVKTIASVVGYARICLQNTVLKLQLNFQICSFSDDLSSITFVHNSAVTYISEEEVIDQPTCADVSTEQ